MRSVKTVSLRVDKALVDRLEALAGHFPASKSTTSLAEAVIGQMLTMMESEPAKRRLPDILAQIDAVRANRARQPLLRDTLDSSPAKMADQVAAHALETVQGMAKKR